MRDLQQPVGTVLRSPSADSLPFISEHLQIFPRNVAATPHTLEQQGFFAVLRRDMRRARNEETPTMGKGLWSNTLICWEYKLGQSA
ncbi:hypothetical protein AVEN_118038-1 [Araneus ventricosus]|uniref:Uncharacterized protein n=1 Tax=Araneus ventricosus TaxID=182803 RepID=A0A4Y2UDD5_ARAVE|nr:hypothetical protein AVEN_118038-1 [Araneus ventricosus]